MLIKRMVKIKKGLSISIASLFENLKHHNFCQQNSSFSSITDHNVNNFINNMNHYFKTKQNFKK